MYKFLKYVSLSILSSRTLHGWKWKAISIYLREYLKGISIDNLGGRLSASIVCTQKIHHYTPSNYSATFSGLIWYLGLLCYWCVLYTIGFLSNSYFFFLFETMANTPMDTNKDTPMLLGPSYFSSHSKGWCPFKGHF